MAHYLQTISKSDSITPDEEAELARRIRQGDRAALEKLVKANLRFVVSVAKQYQNQGISLADLIAEGNIGLVKAAERFDETRGFKFISYAVWWIRQTILDAIVSDSRMIRLPNNQNHMMRQIAAVQNRFEQEVGRSASPEEIADELGVETGRITDTLRASSRGMSLDAPLTDEDGGTLLDVTAQPDDVAADANLEREDLDTELDTIFEATLKPRDIYIIKQTFGIGCRERSQEEVGEELGLTRERVRQIRENAILKLRHCQRINALMAYC